MDSIHTQGELSMASLKGYLMSDKMWPFQAVDDIELWVEDTREGHDRRPVGVAADKTRPHQSHLLDLQGSLLCQISGACMLVCPRRHGVRLYHCVVSLASPPPDQREPYIHEICKEIKSQ
jgi:hypothetical protein